MNKHHLTFCFALSTLGLGHLQAQEPPVPPPLTVAPAPPAPPTGKPPIPPPPPVPAGHSTPPRPEDRRHGHRGDPVNYLGVGVEPIPDWFSEQLNLPEGFGLLVNYVAPGSPAEAAGVKARDVLKQINDQLLANPDQLVSLVLSYPEGQAVSLTVLRKGQETKLTAKLEKKQTYTPDMTVMSAADAAEDFRKFQFRKPLNKEILDQLGPEIQSLVEDTGRKAAERVRREIMILRDKDGRSSSTKMDLSRGRIVIHDDQGEVEMKGRGKNAAVVAKDPAGKTTYTGPAKDAPPGTLDRIGKFGKGDNIVITGDKVSSYEMEDADDDDDEKPTKPSPSPAASPAPEH